MNTYTVQVELASQVKYDGIFEFDNLESAVEKVNNNIVTCCAANDAKNGMDIYGAAHYYDRFGDGSCVIRKGSK